jgi:hypothetical protein
MYKNLPWLDHAVTPERTYKMVQNNDGTVTLTPAGTVVQQGTNMSAANFNNIEMGMTDHDLAIQILAMLLRSIGDRTTDSEDDIEKLTANILAEVTPEEATVTLTNSLRYPLNGSAKSVSLTKNRATKNYTVEAEVTSTDGNVGEIEVTDKALNGFKIAFTGSAKNVTLKIKIRGGIIA